MLSWLEGRFPSRDLMQTRFNMLHAVAALRQGSLISFGSAHYVTVCVRRARPHDVSALVAVCPAMLVFPG